MPWKKISPPLTNPILLSPFSKPMVSPTIRYKPSFAGFHPSSFQIPSKPFCQSFNFCSWRHSCHSLSLKALVSFVQALTSNQRAITIINSYPTSIARSRMKPNVQFLLDFGVNPSSIYYLLSSRPSIFCISDSDFRKAVEEIKGFLCGITG